MIHNVHCQEIKQSLYIPDILTIGFCNTGHHIFAITLIVEFDYSHRSKACTSAGIDHFVQYGDPSVFAADRRQVFRSCITGLCKGSARIKIRCQSIYKILNLPWMLCHILLILLNDMPNTTAAQEFLIRGRHIRGKESCFPTAIGEGQKLPLLFHDIDLRRPASGTEQALFQFRRSPAALQNLFALRQLLKQRCAQNSRSRIVSKIEGLQIAKITAWALAISSYSSLSCFADAHIIINAAAAGRIVFQALMDQGPTLCAEQIIIFLDLQSFFFLFILVFKIGVVAVTKKIVFCIRVIGIVCKLQPSVYFTTGDSNSTTVIANGTLKHFPFVAVQVYCSIAI